MVWHEIPYLPSESELKKMSKETEQILAEIAQVMLLLETHNEKKAS